MPTAALVVWPLALFTILYAAASLLSRALSSVVVPRTGVSPAVKPTDYVNEDILLRRSLVAVNWSLVANKARALYYLKDAAPKTARRSFSVRPLKRKVSL